VSVSLGAAEPLAAGLVSRRAWHPSGAFIVFAGLYEGVYQLWAAETSPPYRTQLLATLSGGIAGPPVFSADGTRIAAWAEAAGGTDIVVMTLGSRIFDQPNAVL
jgi:Tol biopolymer transport system component